jgi:hypothetical protein
LWGSLAAGRPVAGPCGAATAALAAALSRRVRTSAATGPLTGVGSSAAPAATRRAPAAPSSLGARSRGTGASRPRALRNPPPHPVEPAAAAPARPPPWMPAGASAPRVPQWEGPAGSAHRLRPCSSGASPTLSLSLLRRRTNPMAARRSAKVTRAVAGARASACPAMEPSPVVASGRGAKCTARGASCTAAVER